MRVIAFAIVGLLLSVLPVLAESGDVNADGRIDKDDVRLIDDYLNGSLLLQDSQIAAADADRDGKITTTDRDLLQRRLGGLAVGAPRSAAATQSQIDLRSADSGVVVDKATGRPLAGVEVSLPDEGVTVRTDSEGRFKLPGATPGKILSAKANNYAPSSLTTRGGGGFQLKLERLSPRLQVLDDGIHHLGDDKYGRGSANYADFRLPTQGTRHIQPFTLTTSPRQDMTLRIGSIIGIDTPESAAAGQSQVPFFGVRQDGVRIYLNGSLIKQIYVNGDDIRVTLPRWLMRSGRNELRLETHAFNQGAGAAFSSGGLGGIFDLFGVGGGRRFGVPAGDFADYDDIEFAHLVIEEKAGSEY